MTEAEWIASEDIHLMLGWISWQSNIDPRFPNHRRLRLFASACVRYARESFDDRRMKEAVELVEAFADARTNKERRLIKAARQIARQLFELEHRVEGGNYIDPPTAGYYLLDSLIRVAAPDAASETPDRCSHYERAVGRSSAVGDETRRRLLTDIYGNWFRRTRINSRWRTADVLGLARGIYDERAFDRLPLLADALMDAGCDSEDVLSHCRGEGPHVRGCWVVDLVLGKE